jgi:hypothetical protein
MDTKLTLSLNKAVIEAAKAYAKSNQISLSKLIEAYLSSLAVQDSTKSDITPLVKSLSGVITLDDSDNLKDGYAHYLSEKYK